MSEPLIESDAERDARKEATALIGYDNHGKEVFALFVIDPSGHLVQVPIGFKLKPGWQYATEGDYLAKVKATLTKQGLSTALEPDPLAA